MQKLIAKELIDNLAPDEARLVFELLTKINEDRYEMSPIIARACDELDKAILCMGGRTA